MDRAERARIFMPFAALKGYYDLILAQEDGQEVRRELDDETVAKISYKLNRINKGSSIEVSITVRQLHYEKGKVSRIDYSYKYLVVNTSRRYGFDDIMDIEDYIPYGRNSKQAEKGLAPMWNKP